MELDNLYQEVILDHYKHPQNKGLNPTYDAQVQHVNISCGDEITLNISVMEEKISSLTWDGSGCSISLASVSMMSDLLTDKPLEEAENILNTFMGLMQSKGNETGDAAILEDAVAFAGVSKFPARIKCALLGWMAFKDAAIQVKTNRIYPLGKG